MILARRFGLGGLMRRTLERYFYMDHAPGESFDCQWLSGCFLMLRNKAVEKVGLFDESFGKYFEDVDMCLRMARAGWHVMYHGATRPITSSSATAASCSPPTPGSICGRICIGWASGAIGRAAEAAPYHLLRRQAA